MAWVMGRRTSTGKMRWTGRYRDANGRCHSTAIRPSPASPTTSRSGWLLRIIWNRERTSA